MNDMIFDNYQNYVNGTLIRHNNILDVLTKFSETNAKVNRAIVKSINNCGCTKLLLNQNCNLTSNTDSSNICPKCRDIIESEIGNNLYYLTALCNILNINLYDVLLKEHTRMEILGKFNIQ